MDRPLCSDCPMTRPHLSPNDEQAEEQLRFARSVNEYLGKAVALLHDSVDKVKRLPREDAATAEAVVQVLDGAMDVVDFLAAAVRDNAGTLCALADTRQLLSRLIGNKGDQHG